MLAQTIPSPPGSPPSARARTNQFSQKSCESPGNALHWSLQPPLAPAALPQHGTLRPTKTVCPSYLPPPNHAKRTSALPAQPCHIRPRPAFSSKPFFRTSQIVTDRLGSSQIVSDCPSAPPAIPAESPKCSPDSASQAGKRARHFASLRVIARHCAPLRGKIRPQTPVKKVSPPYLGIADTSNDWSKNVGIYSMTAFSLNFGSPDSWRANRRASRSGNLCPSQESDVP